MNDEDLFRNFHRLQAEAAARKVPDLFGRICNGIRQGSKPHLRQAALQLRHFLYRELPAYGGIPGPDDIALRKFGEALLEYIDYHAPPPPKPTKIVRAYIDRSVDAAGPTVDGEVDS